MRRVFLIGLPLTTTALMLLASPALAKNGEGIYGPASDLVVTNFAMGLVVFFTVLVFALTGLQTLRERQKQAREERFKSETD